MVNNLNQFKPSSLNKYDEKYKISVLSSLKESDVELLLDAGFSYNVATNNFTTNIYITNTLYNVIVTYYDNNFRMYAKLSTIANYNDSTNKFSVSAKKTLITTSTTSTSPKYDYSIEYMLFKFESWIETTEYTNIKNVLSNKIGNRILDIEYKKDEYVISRITNTRFFVKVNDDKYEAYDIHNKFLTKDDLLNLDKIVVETIKTIDEKANIKLTFKEHISAEKNTIQ